MTSLSMAGSSSPSDPSKVRLGVVRRTLGNPLLDWSVRLAILVLAVLVLVRFWYALPPRPVTASVFLERVSNEVVDKQTPYFRANLQSSIAHFNANKPENCPAVAQPGDTVEAQNKAVVALRAAISAVLQADTTLQVRAQANAPHNELKSRADYLVCGLVGNPDVPSAALQNLTPAERRDYQAALAPINVSVTALRKPTTTTQSDVVKTTGDIPMGLAHVLHIPKGFTYTGRIIDQNGVVQLGYLQNKEGGLVSIGTLLGSPSLDDTVRQRMNLLGDVARANPGLQAGGVTVDGPYNATVNGMDGRRFSISQEQGPNTASELYYILQDKNHVYLVLYARVVLPAQKARLGDIRKVALAIVTDQNQTTDKPLKGKTTTNHDD